MSDFQADLYDIDYYAWTQNQAARLRTLAGDNRIDAAHLAEEIEDLGKSELHAVESHVERILEHFLKIEFSGLQDPVRHWQNEISIFRNRLLDRLTQSLRNHVLDTLDRRYWYACREVARSMHDVELRDRLPKECPYGLEQVLDTNWYPVPRSTR
ncbi:MAG: DUF29 family protein [Alphaproteobacteria bacterium]|jgi:hypothetical protein|nr:DUF29 family protein [Alphaproteobacteria bacterium]